MINDEWKNMEDLLVKTSIDCTKIKASYLSTYRVLLDVQKKYQRIYARYIRVRDLKNEIVEQIERTIGIDLYPLDEQRAVNQKKNKIIHELLLHEMNLCVNPIIADNVPPRTSNDFVFLYLHNKQQTLPSNTDLKLPITMILYSIEYLFTSLSEDIIKKLPFDCEYPIVTISSTESYDSVLGVKNDENKYFLYSRAGEPQTCIPNGKNAFDLSTVPNQEKFLEQLKPVVSRLYPL